MAYKLDKKSIYDRTTDNSVIFEPHFSNITLFPILSSDFNQSVFQT